MLLVYGVSASHVDSPRDSARPSRAFFIAQMRRAGIESRVSTRVSKRYQERKIGNRTLRVNEDVVQAAGSIEKPPKANDCRERD